MSGDAERTAVGAAGHGSGTDAAGRGRPDPEGRSGWPAWRPPQFWNLKAPQWKTAAWMGALLVAGLILLLQRPAAAPSRAASAGLPSTSSAAPSGADSAGSADPLSGEEEAMAARLSAALGRIAGAGAVSVDVRLAAGPTTRFATDAQDSNAVTSETGTGAGAQTTTQTTTSTQVVTGAAGAPVVEGVQSAQVAGVLVVASGATDPVVAAELARAAQALTGAPLYRITVLPGQGG